MAPGVPSLGEVIDAIELTRGLVSDGVRRLLGGDAAPEPATVGAAPGWFPPDGATYAVHTDLAMLVGGIRALFLQTLHPLAMAGVADHSDYRSDPLGRLQRTGAFVGTTTFGSVEQATEAVEVVRRVHHRVRGTAPDGRPYVASDPRLLLWVHVTEVDSFLTAHQRYGRAPLEPERADRYVAEMAVVARALGAEDVPETTDALAASIRSFRPELHAGRQARDAVRFLLLPPLPAPALPPYGVLCSAAITTLPGWARWQLRLPVAPLAEPLAVRPAALVLLRLLGWALGPHPARHPAAV